MKKLLYFSIGLSIFLNLSAFAQATSATPSSEIYQKIKKLNVLTSVLYVAAHPDDENTLMLTYLSKEKLARTGYLSLTRGDGGQNLIGTEQGYHIGVIRTQELLAARRIDGAEQFFSRAYDFGFSKTKDETLTFWNEDKILSDLVWVIRQYQPDVIITRFPPDPRAGHGHHQSSALLAEKAFHIAADPKHFPEQLAFTKPWQAKRLVWNSFSPGFTNQAPQEEKSPFLAVELGLYNPLLGKSYTEIAAQSRSQHKSQGFGSTPVRDVRIEYLVHKAGAVAQRSMFDQVDTTWNRVKDGQKIISLVDKVLADFSVSQPYLSVPQLVTLYKTINSLDPSNLYVRTKAEEVKTIIKDCLGLWFESTAQETYATAGEKIKLQTFVVSQSPANLTLKKVTWHPSQKDTLVAISLKNNEAVRLTSTIQLADSAKITQPYWLEKPLLKGSFDVSEQRMIGKPESDKALFATYTFVIEGETFTFSSPVTYKYNDPIDGEIYQPFEIRPSLLVNFQEPVHLFTNSLSKKIALTLTAGKAKSAGKIKLNLPQGWTSEPVSHSYNFSNKNEEQQVIFTITPPKNPAPSSSKEFHLTATIEDNGSKTSKAAHALSVIQYKHIPKQTLFPIAETKIALVDAKVTAKKIGYFPGAGDDIPKALKQLGCEVTEVSSFMSTNELQQFDAIVVGVRAYNTNDRIAVFHQRLMEYVKNGGTAILQYNTSMGLKTTNLGPYPLTLGRDRVAEEDAEVRFLAPNHRLLTYPNKITSSDFQHWIQERGLYFVQDWSKEYTPLLSSNDTGESAKEGILLHAPYGKGHYIYTGLSFFRELPAGVPGAYRLFANLLSVGK